ncbi:FxsB family radical SAM/SPASM domain protein [Nocardiopsis sp. N85]|uniref:FxsB family cyclophane-forming radical SAM/SPASM peptide maturase n=1 Tax=Nocardiopsis sp. N85 TaxID=3029400 RepID=UPI00237F526C|nr:FxsB family cyclophane-forming radical SAM/SPASM peptide maturase [Nocardiopsis sp. N85]MDE3723341.1 FxsB family radical SAM/SPASM domain protein [Nocardiopsis sp. N85]
MTDDPVTTARPHQAEWPAGLDVEELLAQGWRPTPFRQFVLKIHSRCNLACDYCYMYEMADQGWRRQPRRMARSIVDRVAERIAEHARTHDRSRVDVILHGGEPLLAGADHIRYVADALRKTCEPDVHVSLRVQTNGVLVDDAFLDLFDELGVRVGVSVDGAEEDHDRHRRRANGRGTHAEVRAALDRLTRRHRHLLSGLLATVDLESDPVTTYEALLEFDPPGVDFLLPHGTWDAPPPGLTGEGTPYGDWLTAVFDRWYGAPVRETDIRMFTEIIRLVLGSPSRTESVGLSPAAMVVIETDGSVEQVDSLKAVAEGAAGTPFHILTHPFTEALYTPGIVARQIGLRALSDTCVACPLVRVCGGGLYPHRHRRGTGFRNPSVYCADLARLITHVHQTVAADVARIREEH